VAASKAFITLRPGTGGVGLTIPAEPLRLLWDLEQRGFRLSTDHGDIVIEPFDRLTPADCEALRHWKPQCVALLGYEPLAVVS